jgi:hypothetical protein
LLFSSSLHLQLQPRKHSSTSNLRLYQPIQPSITLTALLLSSCCTALLLLLHLVWRQVLLLLLLQAGLQAYHLQGQGQQASECIKHKASPTEALTCLLLLLLLLLLLQCGHRLLLSRLLLSKCSCLKLLLLLTLLLLLLLLQGCGAGGLSCRSSTFTSSSST